ncbi:hypothetical protein [Saccharibacillus sp. JS10]|uniref:hypothetical protein n=1 Tax=Saccharibacillus sp. JS10 TaxID=2950552 RepID=UPI0021093B7D|nr:hypothetical protein [Saccharibacillus sp. JS10]MCQ4087283.1 hypothetical protein [Saccharibacillus sp. JS10]
MKILSKESGRLLMEGSTLCTHCAYPHQFLVEYDCVEDRYYDPNELASISDEQSAAPFRL